MKIVLSHPTGNRNVRAVLQSVNEAGLLAEFETTLAVNSTSGWLKYLPGAMRQELLRRSYEVSPDKIWTHGFLEIARTILPKINLNKYVIPEDGFASIYSVYKDFDKAAAKRLLKIAQKTGVSAVYAYEDGALAIFKQAKELGLTCIYDLPIAYWETGRQLMSEEAERLPKWAKTLGGGIFDSQEKLDRKTQEMELADVIIGPGEFVMSSIPKWAQGKKTIMAPFGSPSGNIHQHIDKKTNNPLRVLFAGSMGQRKGLGDLFAAFKLLNRKDIELVVMGSMREPMEFYRTEYPDFVYEAGRPQPAVLALMRSCDIFCLPSIVEGRALVMQEAMSQGLPIVITKNTGGADLVIEGKTGFLVPIRSPEAIAEKLNWFLENRSSIAEMGQSAKNHAAKYTWGNYGTAIINSLTQYYT
jgi:glycosyltransferase involved in cell wall biosynthesis